jgi:hypothetical protein
MNTEITMLNPIDTHIRSVIEFSFKIIIDRRYPGKKSVKIKPNNILIIIEKNLKIILNIPSTVCPDYFRVLRKYSTDFF